MKNRALISTVQESAVTHNIKEKSNLKVQIQAQEMAKFALD
jgi:hypothetical protein